MHVWVYRNANTNHPHTHTTRLLARTYVHTDTNQGKYHSWREYKNMFLLYLWQIRTKKRKKENTNTKENPTVEKIQSSHAHFPVSPTANRGKVNWSSGPQSCLCRSRPFQALFCPGEVWKRRSSCWTELMRGIWSDATFLNIWGSRAGRRSSLLPELWGCLIFVKACWKKTVEEKRGERFLLMNKGYKNRSLLTV